MREAAKIFYEKGANPRHIRGALGASPPSSKEVRAESVLFAAQDLCSSADLASAVYADYWAIRCCSSRSFFPWAADLCAYPFPKHLVDVVKPLTGEVHDSELNRRLGVETACKPLDRLRWIPFWRSRLVNTSGEFGDGGPQAISRSTAPVQSRA